MQWQTEKFNGLDSTSIQIEKAQELLSSLVYTLVVAVQENNISAEMLLHEDLRTFIHIGQKTLGEKQKSVKNKWSKMCYAAPQIQNVFYVETLKNLGLFFKRYDIYYSAHQIPCSIDYPLISPVSEEIQGISYIEEYIRRISIENSFLNRFEIQQSIRLFESSIINYKEYFFNMCEPVFINAIGKMLLGKEIYSLDIPEKDRMKIVSILKDNTNEIRTEIIYRATEKLCNALRFNDNNTVVYFKQAASDLCVRINSVINLNDLSQIFVSFLPQGIIRAGYDEQ